MTNLLASVRRRIMPIGLTIVAGMIVVPSLAGGLHEEPPVDASLPPEARSGEVPGPAATAPAVDVPQPTAAPTSDAPQLRAIGTRPPFTDDSPWNTPIADDARVDRNSDRLIDTIDGPLSSNVTAYTYPVYYVGPDTPRVPVPARRSWTVVRTPHDAYTTDILWVPIPPLARPSEGSDAQMIIIETETGIEYDLWGVRRTDDGGWQARNASRYNVHWDGVPPRYGSRGAGVPYIAGLIRPEEIAAGAIEHALAFAYDRPREDVFVYPATKTDGEDDHRYAIPEGARIQLDPSANETDFDEWGLDRTGRIIARALQEYGMYLVDYSGSNKIYAEDLSVNVYRQREGVSWSHELHPLGVDTLSGIPTDMLRVLELPDGYWD